MPNTTDEDVLLRLLLSADRDVRELLAEVEKVRTLDPAAAEALEARACQRAGEAIDRLLGAEQNADPWTEPDANEH